MGLSPFGQETVTSVAGSEQAPFVKEYITNQLQVTLELLSNCNDKFCKPTKMNILSLNTI